MIKSIEVSGRDEEEAVQSALSELGLVRDDVSIEILERARSGFFGLGGTKAVVRVSYSSEETKSEQVENFLAGLLEKMEVGCVPVLTERDGAISVVFTGPDAGALIGRRGETLDAVQRLTNYAVNHRSGSRTRISIDAEGYRERRDETLQRLAGKVADKVLKYRRNMTLEPMNSYERHVIHTALQDYDNISTYSVGAEPNRRVVVAYDRGEKTASREWK